MVEKEEEEKVREWRRWDGRVGINGQGRKERRGLSAFFGGKGQIW